ncbi:MAG: type II secretion system F family protein [Pirellulales bacterium]
MGWFRANHKDLAGLCRRLATSLEAGIDMRKIWEREAVTRRPGRLRNHCENIQQAVAGGETLTDALAQTGDYFPTLFLEMVEVGEETGNLAEIFVHLANHYDHEIFMRRAFLGSIAWPLLQLTAAVLIIGLLIFILGMIPTSGGKPIDVLGLGVVGAKGAFLWFFLVGCVLGTLMLVFVAMQRGVFWTKSLQKLLLRVPVLGPALQTLALSRLAWSLQLTLDTSLELRRALRLSLRSTRNARYTDDCEQIVEHIAAGHEIGETLAETGAYPQDFLDSLEVGERSGRLPESMKLLSKQYEDRARRAFAVLTMIVGFLVWAAVAAIIILMIFRIFSFYIGAIYEAMEPI